jgi:hypothetical protein
MNIYFNDKYSGINEANEHLHLYISLIPFMQHQQYQNPWEKVQNVKG